MTSAWLKLRVRTTLPAFVLAALAVAGAATVAKWAVERFTPLAYEIHWFTTVPALVVLLALVLNHELNVRAARREAPRGPASPPSPPQPDSREAEGGEEP